MASERATEGVTSVAALPAGDRPTLAVASALFLVAASFTLAKTGRDALYFEAGGIYDLPLAYVGMAVLSLPVALGTLSVMRRTGTRRARVAFLAAAAGALAGYGHVARPGGGVLMTLLFMAVPLAYHVLFALVWLLGADLMGPRTAQAESRFYGRIGGASLAGSLAGALGARAAAGAGIEPATLLTVAGAVLSGAVVVVAAAQRMCPPAPRLPRAAPMVAQTARLLLRGPHFREMLAVAVAAAMTGILIEFQFYLAAATEGGSARENAVLFANLYIGLSAVAVAVQVFLTPALQDRVGVGGALLVLPAVLAALTPLAVINPSLSVGSGLRLAEGGLKSSVHRVSWERAFLVFPPRQRGPAKLLIDGSASRIAEGLMALLIYLWLAQVQDLTQVRDDATWTAYALLAIVVAWTVLALTTVLRSIPGPVAPPGLDVAPVPRGPECCPLVTTLGAGILESRGRSAVGRDP